MERKNTSNAGQGLGIAGLVVGMVSVPLAIIGCTFITGLVLGILGITLSAIGFSQAKKAGNDTGLMLAALIIAIVGTSIATYRVIDFVVNKPHLKIEAIKKKMEVFDDASDEFEESFEKEFGEPFEDAVDKIEEDVGERFKRMNETMKDSLRNMSDEELARRFGKATGKAFREFLNEFSDTTE
jgi:hypothetical protein